MSADQNPNESTQLALPPWSLLEGKVVMLTGASSGIGRELCLDLARAGCFIVAAARRTDRLQSLCDEINGAGSATSALRSVPVQLDVSGSETEIENWVKRAWDAFGRIDALVNNAGIRGGVRSVLEWSEDELSSIVRTNLIGLWLITKHVCIQMRSANLSGSIINISSAGGVNRGHVPGGLPYIASKGAVNFSTKVMALELGEYKIRVNAIAPGVFKSEITAKLIEKKWFKSVISKIVPLKTGGTSDPALTSLVRYLIHDSSEYVTGNIFVIDGGATLPGVPIYSSL
ncbi:NAD(P)-binding Rossmann-fold superfamily protein [Rhynchospora pubera]|uniref:NAD(P)-binding Rossmann-fold superfamily protein n=1 Tax=Rhynchospora pubera TaxID=906938 RepID=A0AAV8BW69_9POAL|nr:NAD(P)-binding Rossmann-fold superfamily protein [Rhynchospora pubera]